MRMIGPFEIHEVLARGGHAAVHVACWPAEPHLDLVAKVAAPGHELRLHHENRALRAVNHANLVAPVGFVDDSTNAALVLPRAACSLRAHEGRLDETEVLHVAIAIADALTAMHRVALAHNDVTAGNILLRADGTPLLADLGRAHPCTEDSARADVAALARTALDALAADGTGDVRSVLDHAMNAPSHAHSFAAHLRASGVQPRRPDALAASPVVDEPPTMALG